VLLTTAAAIAAGWWAWRDFERPRAPPSEVVVRLPRGAGLESIAANLAKAGVIEHPRLFAATIALLGENKRLKAGEYRFAGALSPRGVMRKLIDGDVVVRKLTVPEGLTVMQILTLLAGAEGLEPVGAPSQPREGGLLPDTYHYVWGDNAALLVERMRRGMDEALRQAWDRRNANLPLRGPAEALVLASIVEKETGIAAERRRVAGVFVNRLRRGMKLQSDPTVIYGLTQGKAAFERALSRADLQSDTLWNTYVVDGLPPTPIANPGRESLAAAVDPEAHDFLYFVADGSGGHVFARTLEEHNRNVARWRATRAQTQTR